MLKAAFWTHAAIVVALSQAFAQADVERPAPSAQAVEQKLTMLDKVLNQSPVVARVAASNNEKARRHVASARELALHARTLTTMGQLRGADALVNEAIIEISRAQQLVPDPGSQQAGERARYAQLEDSVSALRRTAEIALPQGDARAAEAAQRVTAKVGELVQQATTLARADKYIEANRQLDQAVVLLLRDASARLAGQTIVYDRKFADRKEEFAFELARHRSFERLVPLALLEYRPSPEALALVERHVAEARELREAAEGVAGRDALLAIRKVNEGTDALRRALQAAGLVVPQTMGSN
ncbi:hypothetical protein [Ramlibacter albus]|uniref:YfdX family protein n=1 Tax=Ramlibacter albus TaxID=2079448 RepID=A0A923M511_9BURK|nr:hypothetical protein [Ramlibacter albus]MBC5764028.1 hypothetical protein [Ramlibacter albus]